MSNIVIVCDENAETQEETKNTRIEENTETVAKDIKNTAELVFPDDKKTVSEDTAQKQKETAIPEDTTLQKLSDVFVSQYVLTEATEAKENSDNILNNEKPNLKTKNNKSHSTLPKNIQNIVQKFIMDYFNFGNLYTLDEIKNFILNISDILV